MKFSVITLGCKVNSYESEYIKERFREAGYTLCDLDSCPDVIIVNTCSVTNQSDAKSRQMIRQAKKANVDGIVVVCGCSAQNHQNDLLDLGADVLIGNKDKSKIVELVQGFRESHKPISKFYPMENLEFEDMLLTSREDKTRAFVKIQDGCDNFCAYCIIPYLRGNIRSKDIDRAFSEIKDLVAMGHKEIVLTGIHTGSYGRGTNYDLVDLIRRISAIPELERIRISSIEITELGSKFMEELRENEKICDHLHIPLQSGSDSVLKRMNRKYTCDQYALKIEEIRTIRPNISITTDLIVGFPYETDEAFEETYQFLKKIHFTKIHTFPFSLRNGTKAEEMKDGFVDEKKKKERVKRVLDLSSKMENEYYRKFIGKKLSVIVESSKDGKTKGHTSNYILVDIDKSIDEGRTISVKITSVDDRNVNGTVETVE